MENPIKNTFNISQTQTNLITENFTNFMLDATSMAKGKTNDTNKVNLVSRWNHECNEAIKSYKKCLNRFKNQVSK